VLDSAPTLPQGAAFFPALFVLLWSTGFIAAKYGPPYAPPFTFLLYRVLLVALLMLAVALGETLDALAIAGMAMIATGVMLARPGSYDMSRAARDTPTGLFRPHTCGATEAMGCA
jgi:drug/metabolite transporter (DMT)-like permease